MEKKLMKDIEWRACKEMEEIHKKKDLSPADWDMLHNMSGTVKNLKKIEEYEDYTMDGDGQDGYTKGGRWMANGSMEGEYGHAGRRRDRMGRYTNTGGYSQHGDNLVSMLEEKMKHARTDLERENIRRCRDTVMSMV